MKRILILLTIAVILSSCMNQQGKYNKTHKLAKQTCLGVSNKNYLLRF